MTKQTKLILGGLFFVELIFKPLELEFDWIAARNVLGGGLTLAHPRG